MSPGEEGETETQGRRTLGVAQSQGPRESLDPRQGLLRVHVSQSRKNQRSVGSNSGLVNWASACA